MLACFGGQLCDLPVVVTRPVMIEDQILYSPLRRKIYSFIDRATTLRIARHTIAVSLAGYRHLSNYSGVDTTRLRLIYNGIHLESFPPRLHGAADGSGKVSPVVIGMVAQLFPPKGWPDFIEVIDSLRHKGFNVFALIVGEGELRETLEADVARRNLQSYFEFTGFREDVASLYQRMDIFLFTTHREGLSLSVIEAMASGLPIVATEVGGIREQVDDGRNGHVVQVGDISAMVRHCTRLIQDPAVRAAMGRVSRQNAEKRFSEHRMLEQYAACYQEVAAKKRSGIGNKQI
jgi:glycosyltransferase involved in cell wall biosynthesis